MFPHCQSKWIGLTQLLLFVPPYFYEEILGQLITAKQITTWSERRCCDSLATAIATLLLHAACVIRSANQFTIYYLAAGMRL